MKTSSDEVARVRIDVVSPFTGEVVSTSAEVLSTSKYYIIKKLNKRICIMDLFTMQSKICNSSKSIEIFRDILYSTDKDNIFNKNITKFAKLNGFTRQQVSLVLKKFVDIGLAKRVDRGEYLINPLAFQSKGSTNELIEKAQIEWEKLKNDDEQ